MDFCGFEFVVLPAVNVTRATMKTVTVLFGLLAIGFASVASAQDSTTVPAVEFPGKFNLNSFLLGVLTELVFVERSALLAGAVVDADLRQVS